MKIIYNTLILIFLTFSISNATPVVTSFQVLSNYLQNGKIKVYNGGPTEFLANIGAARAYILSGTEAVLEPIEMELVFYIPGTNGAETVLKTITLKSSDFDGLYLRYYNEEQGRPTAANNLVKVAIPENLNGSNNNVFAKYRYKDANGVWQPVDQGGGSYRFVSNYYTTINVSPVDNSIDPAILTKISSMGFATDGAAKYDDYYYLVEDDIMLSKQYVNDYTSTSQISFDDKNVYISIGRSIWANYAWFTALKNAINIWNSAENSDIKLHFIFSDSFEYDSQQRTDITILEATNLSKMAFRSRFPNGNGKPGSQILFNPNFINPNTNTLLSQDQVTWALVHAIGHSLGLKHAVGVGQESSVMKRSLLNSYQSFVLSSDYDKNSIGNLHPLSVSSTNLPVINGPNNFQRGTSTFQISYQSNESGINYTWEVNGINGTTFNATESDTKNLEIYLGAGNYQVKCTTSGGKYSFPSVAIKNVHVL